MHSKGEDPQFTIIPPEEICRFAGFILPSMKRGLSAASDITAEETVNKLAQGKAQLWGIVYRGELCATFLTEKSHDSAKDADFIGVYALGGKYLLKWSKALDEIMGRFARSCECNAVRFCGREAWRRILPEYQVIGERLGMPVYERAV